VQDRAIIELELGGVTEAQYKFIEFSKAKLEQASAMDSAGRGQVEGTGTATEHAEAAAARSNRQAFIQHEYHESVREVLQKFGWYIHHSELIDFPLPPEAISDLSPRPSYLPPENQAEQLAYEMGVPVDQMREALMWHPQLYVRKGTSYPEGLYFDEAMITIEPMSMERTNEPLLQKRRLEWMGLIIKVAPMIRQFPEIDWMELLNRVGATFNENDAADLINIELAKQMAMASMVAQTDGSAPSPAGAQPSGGGYRPGEIARGPSSARPERSGDLMAAAVSL